MLRRRIAPFALRRGVVSVLAMLYMVLFSAMALGFYAATTTASQVAANERTTLAAQLAAESGIQFLRYHLSALDIQAGLSADKIFGEVYQQLAERLEPTANLNGNVVGFDGNTITIPQTGYVKTEPGGAQKFRITITRAGDILVARVVGRGGAVTLGRGVEVRFQKANRATAIFNFGVASKGRVITSGQSTITGDSDPTKGSVLSTNTTDPTPTTNRQRISLTGENGEYNVPFFHWLPRSVQESFVFLHLHYRPSLANYTQRPAVHWFSYADLCALGRQAGFAQFYSPLDLRRRSDVPLTANPVKRLLLQSRLLEAIQRSAWLRALALTQLGSNIVMLKRNGAGFTPPVG